MLRILYSILLLSFSLTLALFKPVCADNYSVAVHVYCDDTFTQNLISGFIIRELRNIQGIIIVDKVKDAQIKLSIIGLKTKNNWIALSIMKVQYIFSVNINPNTGKHEYAIGRSDHYVGILPMTQLQQTCSDIVTEFDATYVESLRLHGTK